LHTLFISLFRTTLTSDFCQSVLGTRLGSLELKIVPLESEKIIKGNIYEI